VAAVGDNQRVRVAVRASGLAANTRGGSTPMSREKIQGVWAVSRAERAFTGFKIGIGKWSEKVSKKGGGGKCLKS